VNRLLFASGARGPAIEEIQRALPLPRIDGVYGNRTTDGVCQFQRRAGFIPSGATDSDTWNQLVGQPIPALAARCLALTAAFEGHGYTLAQGNFDGAGITWGIIGFTLKSGSLGQVLARTAELDATVLPQCFGPLLAPLLENLAKPAAKRVAWAGTLSEGANLAPPWRLAFDRLGANAVAQRAQQDIVDKLYWGPAVQTAHALNFSDELSFALCFDIQVQNGGPRTSSQRQVAGSAGSPAQRRGLLARLTAATASPQWQADVLERKLTIATGTGRVHGRRYAVGNWGLGEYPAD
jgi:Glycosyl hydrolase family 46/Putative peptidoglycan binding domain